MSTSTRNRLNKTSKDFYRDVLQIKEALEDTADGVKSRAGHLVTDLLKDLQKKENNVEEYVKEKPMQSLGFAVLFGVILAKFIL
jgi:ElaB/YqjD/DUF883 family membrane-anchored ribosome-binding protein